MTDSVQHLLKVIADRVGTIESRLSQLEAPSPTPILSQIDISGDSFFRRIAEATSDIIVEGDADGTIEFISQSIRQLGYYPEVLVGTNGFELVHPDDRNDLAQLLAAMQSTHQATTTLRVRHVDGDYVHYECRLNILETGDRPSTKIIVVARDISQRLEIVKELQDSVLEKEVLLKEIHHRVKNNLQIISSMLSIQSHYFGDPQVKEVFRECQNRIKSMALIHETLYMSKNLANIEFSGYIKNLVQRLSLSYRETATKIAVNISIPKVTLHIDTAIACGLIVNELVTNSFKHGFPGERSGQIWVSLLEEDARFALTVRDNGVGFPKDIDLAKSNSMGLQLVTTLSHQLDADLDLDKVNGTSITLTFSKSVTEDQD